LIGLDVCVAFFVSFRKLRRALGWQNAYDFEVMKRVLGMVKQVLILGESVLAFQCATKPLL